jgi:hypothetical protein
LPNQKLLTILADKHFAMMDPLSILVKYGLNPPEDYAWFDAENFDEGKDYLELFNWLVAITKGTFQPQILRFRSGIPLSGFVDYMTEIQFDIENVSQTIKLSNGWFDKDLITALNTIVDKHLGLNEKFYGVKTGDQSLIIVFVGQLQKEELEKEDMIDHFDDYEEKPVNINSLEIIDCRWTHP